MVINTGVSAGTGHAQRNGQAEADSETAQGWYLYGITQEGPLEAVLADVRGDWPIGSDAAAIGSDAGALQLIESVGLVAVVRPVLLADFSADVLQERLRDASALEAMVRSHHGVIEAIHAQQSILPARFGMVYTHARDIQSTLRSARDTLLSQLRRVEGCDEWAVHVYADRAVVRERVRTADSRIRGLHEQSTAARPGRAFFLERQLRDELEAVTREILVGIAQNAFDRLEDVAVAGKLSSPASGVDAEGAVEILRATFLVTRERADQFMEEVHSGTDATDGLRCECTGPWPPYSFAALDDEEAA